MAGEAYRQRGEAAWAWVMGQVRGDEGPWLPEVVPDGLGGDVTARTMADAITDRAIRDQAGARWWFTEHRQDPPLLPPGTS